MLDEHFGLSENEDSLFGSPPPSPARGRGRSPSPALALPSSTSTGSSSAQNVGTIALPGSHAYSELPINPLALSLSGYTPHSRPPAQTVACVPLAPHASSPPSRSPSHSPTVAAKRKRASKSTSSAPRSSPRITLPDPNEPLPPNFLRNQQALLGVAGMVGGVNPANLSVKRPARGSSRSNPILVEDELNPPIGQGTSLLPLNAAKLPPPPIEAVIASLIEQKNIFPILHSVLKLFFAPKSDSIPLNPSTISLTEVESRDAGRSSKKRKFAGVPAGAGDWDVPYPTQGSGGVQSSWERQRGKKLIAQLAGAIKSASEKAATKSYLMEKGLLPNRKPQHKPKPKPSHDPSAKVYGHYRPATMAYGLDDALPTVEVAGSDEVIAGHANLVPLVQNPSHVEGDVTAPSDAPTFDEIITALMQLSTQGNATNPPSDPLHNYEDVSTPSTSATPEFDQDDFHTWLDLLNISPPPEEPQTQSAPDTLPAAQSTDPWSMDVDASNSHPPSDAAPSPFSDATIDPVLLALSQTQMINAQSTPIPPTPALVPSPMLSASSLDPLTPRRERAFPETQVFTAEQGTSRPPAPGPDTVRIQIGGIDFTAEDPIAAASMLLQLATGSTATVPEDAVGHAMSFQAQPSVEACSAMTTTVDLTSPVPTTTTTQPQPQVYKRCVAGPGRPSSQSMKEDILSRARERKRQLAAEIERAKVGLWETTIEHGMLLQLSKET